MPYGKLENLQDCEDFVKGCLFMATGGGGSVDWGMGMLKSALDEGLSLEWVDPEQIPDDAWTVTPYGMGSIAPPTQETLESLSKLDLSAGVDVEIKT